MGNILNIFMKNKEFRLLMQGLDAAGKTTILYKLKTDKVVNTTPTIGFNVETVQMKNLQFIIWDVGSRGKMRQFYRHYYANTVAFVFVIDSNDTDRLDEVKHEMEITLREDELRDSKVLILANKQDLDNAVSVTYLTEYLELHKVKHECNIFGTSAVTGEGLEEALSWLSDVVDPSNSSQAVTKDMDNGYFFKGIETIKQLFT